MSSDAFVEEIIGYFINKDELSNGWNAHAPQYYSLELKGGFRDTQLVLAAAVNGIVVNLVHDNRSFSTYILADSSSDSVRTQLDAFVRHFHTETAEHHRRLSNPSPGAKVESNVRGELRALTSLGPHDSGIDKPVFEDEHSLLSPDLGNAKSEVNIGARDLDPLGKHPTMRPGLTGDISFPGSAPDASGGSVNLPSQGGMHPTPWGSNIRYDPPGPPGFNGGGI